MRIFCSALFISNNRPLVFRSKQTLLLNGHTVNKAIILSYCLPRNTLFRVFLKVYAKFMANLDVKH